jgi:hypothetical protein
MQQPRRTTRVRLAACAAAALALAGCSLISVKSPERPLSPEELNARILTREVAAQFVAAVGQCAQDIAASTEPPAVLDDTLRWQIAAVSQTRSAETQIAPLMSLLDTWALALQMQAFVADGAPGGELFGSHQGAVRAVSNSFAADTEAVARRILPPADFTADRQFVQQYAHDYPLRDLAFERTSVVALWSREHGAKSKLVESMGTIPEALTDVAQRLQIYGDTVPQEVMGETQLALRQSGYSRRDLQASLQRLDERLDRLTEVAGSAPALVREAETQVRESLREVIDRLTASSNATTAALRSERIALFADLQAEREAVVAAVDAQRKALTSDGARVADQLVRSAGQQARYVAGEVLLLLALLSIVVLGLPFAAGYLLGRARERRARPRLHD